VIFKGAHSCRRCRKWLEGDWAKADAAGRKAILAQMGQGECWPCQKVRLLAAFEFIRQLNAVRTFEMLQGQGSAPQTMLLALADADDALTRAGLPGRQTRPTRRTPV
jgi:hypothetical protein